MLRSILSILLLFYVTGLMAQDRPVYTITGTILDETGQPMAGASIVDRSTMFGAVADQDGRFTLRVTTFPVFMEVSFIGYDIHYRELRENDFGRNRRLNITVSMQPRSEKLKPVTVLGGKYEEFYVHRNIAVIDFTFVGENTLLLLREGMWDYKLALINEAEDSLATLDIDISADGFTEDCLGHIYMQGRDEVHGLSFAGNAIHLIGTIDNDWFRTKVKPCVASNPHNLYYQLLQMSNQMLDVFQTPMKGGETRLIRRIIDWEDALSIQEYGNEAQAMLNGTNQMGNIGIRDLGRFKDAFAKMGWYQKILSIPVYHPLFATRQGALLFDHLHDSVLVLNTEGEITDRYFVTHHKQKDFAEEILRDVTSGKFYVRYEKSGITRLVSLSDEDFSPQESYVIREKYDFPKSLKIRNGVAYFLDHSDEDYQKLKLYRQKL
ncbi:MAG: carboxypeptidase-like regulatory domain-containing protein [Owenweeksia sp.]